jgi:hypothetical protein
VHYGHAEHFVDDAADTGISKWFLTGTDLDGNSLAARFEGLPDVHYGHAEHFVDDAADTGISKWFLTGTDLDGNKVEVRGCDFYQKVSARNP